MADNDPIVRLVVSPTIRARTRALLLAPRSYGQPGYLNDDEFALSDGLDVRPAGNWSQTGGWRSQQRENALRQQGAQTVAPGHTSAHSLGDDDA